MLLAACLSASAGAAYVLNLGTYPKDEAETLHQQLARRGYPVFLLYGEDYEVRLGSFETREKAQEAADRIRSEEKIVARIQEEEDRDLAQLTYDDEEEGREVSESTGEAYQDDRAKRIISLALDLFGQPYKYGGTRIGKGIDCSYFTQKIFRELGVLIPRTSGEQYAIGAPVGPSELKIGDLVFFKKTYYSKKSRKGKRLTVTRINHVGIYIGNGEFIHATINVKRVTISRLNEPYFVKRFAGARRVFGE